MTVQVIGYARVSTKEQDLSLQLDALSKYGCDRIFTDKMSSVKERQGLTDALGYLREGDTLVVWKLDRLCRSLPDLIKISEQIRTAGAQLVSITESIDTSTPAGRLYFNILGALGQMERELIQERVKAGLAAARRRGRRRPAVRTGRARASTRRAPESPFRRATVARRRPARLPNRWR